MLDDSTSCNLNASPICSCKKWQKVADKENCETTTKLYEIRGRIDISGTLLQMMVELHKTLRCGYHVCVGTLVVS
jgi:hypothetical protein